ncbi:MAG: DUF3108 domain-containing protein [Burkholderiales bacterium]|nr:DUF3108 domain-containing protein [Burkholderiales bacterium]
MKRRPAMRLLAAAALSVAAHAALLAGSWLSLPDPVPELPPLNVQLQPLAPQPVATPRAVKQKTPQRIAAAPRTVPQPEAAIPAAPDPVPVTEPAAPEPVVVASAASTVFKTPEAPPLPSFPRKGRITYLLTMGPDQTPVGRTVQTWEFDGTQYTLGSQSESTGLIEMFRPHRYHYLSRGTVSEQGLRPERFLASVKRGSRSEESLAVFNWEQGQVRLGRMPQQTTVALPAGSQDIISFMYQLALLPPAPGRITMPFTRGRQLESTSFDVLPEETIDTPLGRLRAVPVIQARESGRESLAVWLATEYRNLPIRIRFFNRDGELSGEQLVSAIQVSEQ